MSLTDADRAQLDRWWEEALAVRALPGTVEPVQTRLIRQVGRAELPDAGEVYLKVMGFPRSRDRLRYLLRPLPYDHEARLLGVLERAGIPCPQVLDVRGRRRGGMPHLSFLVLRGLPRDRREPELEEVVGMAGELCRAGIFHPDLHAENCLPLRDGRLAILDLQSARCSRPGLTRGQRLQMAARLMRSSAPLTAEPNALLRAGLLRADEVDAARELAQRFAQRFLEGRIRRCLQQSTQFERRRAWNGVLFQRRGPLRDGTWVRGGGELLRWWIGDRALEVMEQRPPVLRALFRSAWWLPGRHSVYIDSTFDRAALAQQAPILLEGYAAFRRLSKGGASAGLSRRSPG